MKKYRLSGLAAVMALAVFGTGASAGNEEWLTPVGAEAEGVIVSLRDFKKSRYVSAGIYSVMQELSFSVSGEVNMVSCKAGDRVEKYDVLANVSQDAANEKVAKCLADIEDAEQRHMSEMEVIDSKIEVMAAELSEYIPPEEGKTSDNYSMMMYELTQLEIEKLEKEKNDLEADWEKEISKLEDAYDEANEKVTYNKLISPCNGTVIFCSVREGSTVRAGECVIIIQEDAGRFISSSDAEISGQADAKNNAGYYAYIDGEKYEVKYGNGPAEDEEKARFSFPKEAEESNSDTCMIEIVEKTRKNVLMVPISSVYNNGSLKYVYKIQDGVRKMVYVTTGDDDGSEIILTSGDINDGDEIYVP